MKLRQVPKLAVNLACSVVMICLPLAATAEGIPEQPTNVPATPVLITEVQTGAASASDEFIELYNASDDAIDLSGWQIRYANSTVTDGGSSVLVAVADGTIVLSHAHFVLHTASIVLPTGVPGQAYTAGLSKTDKTVALFAPDLQACTLTVRDAVAWESVAGTTQGEGDAVAVPAAAAGKDKLLQRYRDSAGLYRDADSNATDFALTVVYSSATPGASNENLPVDTPATAGVPSALLPASLAGCTLPDPAPDASGDSPPSVTDPQPDAGDPEEPRPSIPAGNAGLRSPLLSELLPNPGPPQTDAVDEFIELYNPNDASFDLSGYVLEAGVTTKHRFTIPDGTSISGHAFLAFFSADTHLALSNVSGQVRLFDPLGAMLAESDAYAGAKDDQAWVLANASWQWTAKPSPNAVNVVTAPVNKTRAASVRAASHKVKTASTSKPKGSAGGAERVQSVATGTPPRDPIHPAVLAVIAASAVLYGAYEYRHDVANKIYQLRSNRAARRAAGQGAKGR